MRTYTGRDLAKLDIEDHPNATVQIARDKNRGLDVGFGMDRRSRPGYGAFTVNEPRDINLPLERKKTKKR